jgi:hypothetical protein
MQGLDTEIVNERQRMSAMRPHKYVCAVRVFSLQPSESRLNLWRRPFPQQHRSAVA